MWLGAQRQGLGGVLGAVRRLERALGRWAEVGGMPSSFTGFTLSRHAAVWFGLYLMAPGARRSAHQVCREGAQDERSPNCSSRQAGRQHQWQACTATAGRQHQRQAGRQATHLDDGR